MQYIDTIESIIEQAEKLKGYWDETGLDMHIAVKMNGVIAVSTKHWSRVHYLRTKCTFNVIWEKLNDIMSTSIGRTLIKSKKGNYVYINKLNSQQTQNVFDHFKNVFGNDVTKVWEYSWKIDDANLLKKPPGGERLSK